MINSPKMYIAVCGVFVLGLAACGGDDTSGSESGTTTSVAEGGSTDSPPDESEPEAVTPNEVTAEVIIEGVTYAFSEGSCTVTIAGDVVSQFSNGDDDLNFTSVNHSLLIRATLGGQRWVEPRGALEADAGDAGNVTWSGSLLKENTEGPLVETAITLHC